MSIKRGLITKIHVAKAQLKMDEDSYRNLLQRVTGTNSCAGMNVEQLERVMDEMKDKGFKVRKASSGRRLSRPERSHRFDPL